MSPVQNTKGLSGALALNLWVSGALSSALKLGVRGMEDTLLLSLTRTPSTSSRDTWTLRKTFGLVWHHLLKVRSHTCFFIVSEYFPADL